MSENNESNGIKSGAAYREILAKRREAEPTYQKVSPSGMLWTLRRVDLQQYVLAGKLPLALAQKVAEALANTDPENAFLSLSENEQLDAMTFLQFLVTQVAVKPRIVKNAISDDEIDEILPEDFMFLLAEAQGGDQAAKFASFRVGPGKNALAGVGGKKHRKARK